MDSGYRGMGNDGAGDWLLARPAVWWREVRRRGRRRLGRAGLGLLAAVNTATGPLTLMCD